MPFKQQVKLSIDHEHTDTVLTTFHLEGSPRFDRAEARLVDRATWDRYIAAQDRVVVALRQLGSAHNDLIGTMKCFVDWPARLVGASRSTKHDFLVQHGWKPIEVSTYRKHGITLKMHEAVAHELSKINE